MKLFVKVKPNANQEKVEKMDRVSYKVTVTASPEKGRANKAVIEVLAKHFDISKSQVVISAGHTTRNKIININN